ncbi:tbc domain protein [Grosmannia clavigera kw1407]|uniref:Tbc domain protein n=1 Tax=Grosmannia clavigera (strain kw1407 / UAMH 11150) TaxID=655863 RepID=F0XQ61_GROCL|nr:tbc domain protein [Grosmannia clavigera kw1407]EFX00751.1 tbc domain protein [Grosmannia clavigera kw1407]
MRIEQRAHLDRQRWIETAGSSASIAALQRAVRQGGPGTPCEAGLRSVCWKIFLLFRDALPSDRLPMLRRARTDYDVLGERYLQYIKHPERLAELAVDPLADDPESPWDTFRRDDVVRGEILQDVRRLPDEPFYHQDHIQTLILDVLFVWCCHHPRAGGYRQGMHELLAPIVYVLGQDAVDVAAAEAETCPEDASMMAMLDVCYLAHDAYALFSAIMDKAQAFYEVSSGGSARRSSSSSSNSNSNSNRSSSSSSNKNKGKIAPLRDALYASPVSLSPSAGVVEQSAIVEMSRAIHEGTLMKIDPELAVHLKEIEVLPQIFLIRWIRLLFGREFPSDQHLVLWDGIFAFDPDLDLVPLICVAMLLRIRWELLEADYSVALPLLLKYPPPGPPYGPHTFVDDALFLRDHGDVEGGASLVLKYTGRAPARQQQPQPQPTTPTTPTMTTTMSGHSRASSAPGTRVAAGSSGTPRTSTPGAGFAAGLDSLRQRTRMAVRSPLRALSPEGGQGQPLAPGRESVGALLHGAAKGAKGVMERGEKLGLNQAVRDAVGEIRRNMIQGLQEARQVTKGVGGRAGGGGVIDKGTDPTGQVLQVLAEMERMEQRNRQLAVMLDETVESLRSLVTGEAGEAGDTDETTESQRQSPWLDVVELAAAKVQFVKTEQQPPRETLPPAAIPSSIPSRATLAQSSFAWMLEPEDTPTGNSSDGSASASSPDGSTSKRRAPRASPVGRGRHAFLFGDVVGASPLVGGDVGRDRDTDPASGNGNGNGNDSSTTAAGARKRSAGSADEIFGLEPLRRVVP